MRQFAPNRGLGGGVLNAQYGSQPTSDTNDPLWLPGGNVDGGYFYSPGDTNSNNYMAFADDGTLWAGDMSIAVRYDPGNRATQTTIVLKRSAAIDGALVPFNFVQGLTAGALGFTWYDSVGAVHQLYTATLVPTAAKWVGVQHDIDNGAGGNTARLYWSMDGETWTLLATVNEGFLGTRRINTGQIGIAGTDAGVAGSSGRYYEVKMWNSLTFSGTPTRHIHVGNDVSDESVMSFRCSSGQTVTITRPTTGRKAVMVSTTGKPRWLLGTDDYMTAIDNALLNFDATESFTVGVKFRQWPNPLFNGIYLGKGGNPDGSGNYDGYHVRSSGSTFAAWGQVLEAGSTDELSRITGTYTPGTIQTAGFIVDRTANTLQAFLNDTLTATTSLAAIGDMTTTVPLGVGRSMVGSASGQEFELFEAWVVPRVLTKFEVAQATGNPLLPGESTTGVLTLTPRAGTVSSVFTKAAQIATVALTPVSTWTVKSLPNLAVWLDASDSSTFSYSSSTVVSQWRDKSAAANHAAEATPSLQPNRNGTINGLPAVTFTAAAGGLKSGTTPVSTTAGFTVFAVIKYNAVYSPVISFETGYELVNQALASWGYILSTNAANMVVSGTQYNTSTLTGPASGSTMLLVGTRNAAGTSFTYEADNVAATPGTTPAGAFRQGGNDYITQNPNISIGELIVCNSDLSPVDKTTTKEYLQKKWGASPGGIAGLSLWFDAADDDAFVYSSGTTVRSWKDKSGFDRNASNTLVSAQPTRVAATLNGLPVVSFTNPSGISGTIPWLRASQTIEFFAVAQRNNASVAGLTRLYDDDSIGFALQGGAGQFFAFARQGIVWVNSSAASDQLWHQCELKWEDVNSTATMWRDGTQVYNATLQTLNAGTTPHTFTLGNPGNSEAFQLAELMVFVTDAGISAAQRANIRAYYLTKWGV